jgi:hypothetical protein
MAFTDFNDLGQYNVNGARYLGHHNSLTITGKFQSPNDTSEETLGYIMVGKKGPIDGIDEFQYDDGYGVGIKTGNGNSYNLFVVDSRMVSGEFVVTKDITFFDTDVNGVLSASAKTISPSVVYDFEMKIDANNKLEFRIWDSTTFKPASPDIYTGVRENLSSNGGYFGLVSPNTQGNVFYFKDIKIFRDADDFAYQSFKLRTWTGIENEGAILNIKSAGRGYDTTTGDIIAGVEFGLFKPNDTVSTIDYLLIPSHNSESQVNTSRQILGTQVSDYIWADEFGREFIWVVAKTKGKQISGDSTKQAQLSVDYINLTSLTSEQIHTGGKTDIYVWAPDAFVTKSKSFVVASNPYYLQDSDGNFPILDYKLTTSTGKLLTEGTDYNLTPRNPSHRWSDKEEFQLTLRETLFTENGGSATNPFPVSLRFIYESYPRVKAITDYLQDETRRLGSTDNLAKTAPPVHLSFSKLEYSGAVSMEDLISNLIQKINFEWTTLTAQSLVEYLQSLGIFYVNPDIRIDIVEWDWKGTKVSTDYKLLDSSGITPSNLSKFYIKPDNFLGLTKV